MRFAKPSLDLAVVAEARSPRAVRRAFADHFSECERLDDLLLCLSEVLTNAVLHASGPIHVVAGISDETIRVEVSDGSVTAPVHRAMKELSPTGRGLHILDRLATAWGYEVEAHGKTVWFEIAGAAA
jgi:anti-sigma regulatory factor (Ser/Thr protein kinase)